ncbi:unnamed protein product [Allacma fusca]|uniref:Uncharacterized protein n=1 Tax=Allacma fusca TaxID=39272 RepID=A0A8J2NVJ8_9HEXA|nr:unnamed protein product [Allacma fusca]
MVWTCEDKGGILRGSDIEGRIDSSEDSTSVFGQDTDVIPQENLSFGRQSEEDSIASGRTDSLHESHHDPEGSGPTSTPYEYEYLDLLLPNQERVSLSEADRDWEGSLLTTAGSRKRRTLQASINSSNSPWEASSEDDGQIHMFDDDRHLLIAQNHVEEDDEVYDVIIEDVVSDEGELISRKITTLTDEQADNKENNAI